ncbi:PREDICTED: protein jim lovell [Vollenhovia emeryi]|uniref:protein jim lovell n=1 Tax=Vollenhovia emeryi TaxID=411798 RepID=UPI0005F38318|nr:PREDICTED: protein jim lovell [Vollenhovia emeryi]
MSSVCNSPSRMALQSHYSLRWHNHLNHIQRAFEELLHAETLVDVTLICADSSVKAHKVVLSACSPFFERIFAENPCKHPVIVLKDFSHHELSTLVHFIYRGEVQIAQEELPGLMKAAECLQVRGLSSSEPRPVSTEPRPSSLASTPTRDLILAELPTPEVARHGTSEEDENALESTREMKPILFQPTRDHPAKPLIGHMNFGIRESCGSPSMPRRKQARPRRRSGEMLPQDLSRRLTPPISSSPLASVLNLSGSQHQAQQQQLMLQQSQYHQQQAINNAQNQQQQQQQQQQQEDMAENLSMKKPLSPSGLDQHHVKTEGSEATSSPRGSPLTGTSLLHHPDGPVPDIPAAVAAAVATVALSLPTMPTLSLSQSHPPEYLTSLGQLTSQWLPGHPQSQLPPPPSAQSHHPREDSPHGSGRSHPYQQQQPQESALPRRSTMAMFTPTLDGVTALGGGLFSHHATTYDRGNLLADSLLTDNFKPEALQNLFGTPSLGPPPAKKTKKHRSDSDAPRRWNDHNTRALAVNRPKGQHSAPRGGPPRSWTNNELTLALQHVWEKKLTTSQASRMFGIPYNSLLMYVRGKYGKSLKLEQLRRNCTGASTPEIMNNNNIKPVQQSAQMSHGLAGLPLQHPGDNGGYPHRGLLGSNMPQPQSFYPAEYAAASYPLAVNMVHMLPPSEQKAFESSANPDGGGGGCVASGGGDGSGSSGGGGDLTNSQTSETPSPIVDHHHHQESSMQPQPTQSAPALLQQNGSD